MELICFFDENGVGNPYFKLVYNLIYNRLKNEHPKITFTHLQSNEKCFSCPGGGSNFQIINPSNNNTILMSFWDKGMDPLKRTFGWENYNIIQYVGGLSINISSEEIKKLYNINHTPFQYVLGTPNAYDYVDQCRYVYYPDQKIKKAIFIGAIYADRLDIVQYIKNHPYIEIISNEKGINGKDYFEEISKYRIALSLNGNGEFCLRDLECMGIGIPVVRSELMTQFYNPLIPDYHYIKGSRACPEAWFTYRGINKKIIAEEFIENIEKIIDNYDTLLSISKKQIEYFDNYCKPDYICDLFMKIVKINEL